MRRFPLRDREGAAHGFAPMHSKNRSTSPSVTRPRSSTRNHGSPFTSRSIAPHSVNTGWQGRSCIVAKITGASFRGTYPTCHHSGRPSGCTSTFTAFGSCSLVGSGSSFVVNLCSAAIRTTVNASRAWNVTPATRKLKSVSAAAFAIFIADLPLSPRQSAYDLRSRIGR